MITRLAAQTVHLHAIKAVYYYMSHKGTSKQTPAAKVFWGLLDWRKQNDGTAACLIGSFHRR